MRLTATCWSCTLLLTGHIGGVWATVSENKYKSGRSGKSDNKRPSPWDRLFAQKGLGTECPVDHHLCPDSVGGGCCPKTRVCGMNACFVAIETAVTVSHPKITEAPPTPLFKRKLGSNKWDLIHEGIQRQKRDGTECSAGYQSCAASLNGGCCPNDRVCGTDYCYAPSTATAPATVCGEAGYVACGIAEGGGCCPQSYACQVDGCSPSAGVSNTETCDVSSYLCPASVGYGCCKSGFACGVSACYATSVTTFVLTETLTTTDAENLPHTVTSTITTASTPTVPTDVASNTAPNGVIAKVTPTQTAIPKTSPTSSSTNSGGLTKAQLGGIIGGAVAILVILIIATFLIMRRVNKVAKAVTASQSRTRTSSSGQRSRPSRQQRPSGSNIDAMSIDPLIMAPSESSHSIRYPSHPSATHSSAHEVDASSPSPPTFGSPFSPRSPPFNQNYRGYNPVPTSDSNSSSGYGRNPSLESTPSLGHNPNTPGYFDIPPKPDLRDQNLRFGHSPPPPRPSQHERQWSHGSNISEVSAGSSSVAELDAGKDGDRRLSLQRALQSFGMGKLSTRRRSSQTNPSPTTLPGGPTSRHPEWGPPPNPGAVALGHIPEAGESTLRVHDGGDTEMREISSVEQQEYQGMVDKRDQKILGHGIDILNQRFGRS